MPKTDDKDKDKAAASEKLEAVSNLVSGLFSKLNISKEKDDAAASSSNEKVKLILEEPTIEGVRKYIEGGNCKNIITMAGAGISTAAGIPDFRSPGTGIYDNIKEKYKLDDPQVVFEINYFKSDPKPFFALAKQILPETYDATLSHNFIKLLHEKDLLLRHYTQNIDGLEHKAGVPADKIVEAHGTFHTSHCMGCKAEYSLDFMREKIHNEEIPKCEKCDQVIKPDVVFFGEALPERFFKMVQEDFEKCDLLIIMGTSLAVHPFAGLIEKVKNDCPRVLINREKVGMQDNIMSQLVKKISILDQLFSKGLDFESKNNRDVAIIGDCDEGCKQLAAALSWESEL